MNKRKIGKNFLYQLMFQIVSYIVPLLTAPYISRVFGAELLGKYTYTNTIAYYFYIVCMLGVETYGAREIAKVQGNKEEGWIYLDGMAVMNERGFTIFPAEWNESFGTSIYDRESIKLNERLGKQIDKPSKYGWTLGLNIPTMETVNEAIETLRAEAV